ncbi:hypothetical protein K461DRAFT_284661 [Myriangium duriaei CBS 260.36]|uniref:Alpha-1,2-mannosyltransferase n=1 Tax=Myriangium duriaei CBS 260.36 TaxID=1168546 RepID=A0A9P4JBS3_9PEZI|nr:hypothetical protein K461DRAFT_284661 [Myriangium duriaei CBS 260.36]
MILALPLLLSSLCLSQEKPIVKEHGVTELQKLFPPERRSLLDGNTTLAKQREQALLNPESCVSDKRNVLEESCASLLTPTGFTIAEIRALESFPDYSLLSGVPSPTPYPDFDINKALPRSYRPFRWAYHQTMSLTKLEPDWWLELETTYVDRIKQRQELFTNHRGMVMQTLPGSEIACKELMEMVLQFLCARYPQYFQLTPSSSPETFHNLILSTTTDLLTTPPMQILADNVPEDFAIMLRCPFTGTYSFRAGILCSSLGWSLGSKIGLQLNDIHAPIPDYAEKMSFSMDRYFAKKPVDKPIQRGSWGLEIGKPLFMPPGDPHEGLRERQNPAHTLDDCHLRVDWQTLRRLPLSGAVVFNFKALFTPVAKFREEPYVPKLLLKVLKEGKREIIEYKNTWHTEHVVVPALEEMVRYQEEQGMVEKDWEEHTLDESPFFPGWREKWIAEQGFAPPG